MLETGPEESLTAGMDELLAALERLYQEVDRRASLLDGQHGERLRCRRGCTACCVDEISVYAVEAENIRRHHGAWLATATPHPVGACAFLDEAGACRIYAQRPYVCRSHGYPLRWLDETESGAVELRDICPLNEAGEPIETLPAALCWTIGPVEEALAKLQYLADGGAMRRVRLRTLFGEATDPKR